MQGDIRDAWTPLRLGPLPCFIQVHMDGHVSPFFPRDGDYFVRYACLHGPDKRPDRRDAHLKGTEGSRGDKKEGIV